MYIVTFILVWMLKNVPNQFKKVDYIEYTV